MLYGRQDQEAHDHGVARGGKLRAALEPGTEQSIDKELKPTHPFYLQPLPFAPTGRDPGKKLQQIVKPEMLA